MRAARPFLPALLLLPLLPLLAVPARAAEDGSLRVEPREVGAGLFYHGAEIRMTARVPPGETAVFALLGPERDLRLKIKGRAGGILWVSVGEARFRAVPSVFLVRAWPGLPPPEALREAGMIPESLEARLLPAGAREEDRTAFRGMLRLFEREERYGVVREGERRGDEVSVRFRLVAGAPAGEYRARLVRFAGSRITAEEEATLVVRRTGLEAAMSNLAEENALWYGLLAVVVALAAGLFTGWVFSLGKKRSR